MLREGDFKLVISRLTGAVVRSGKRPPRAEGSGGRWHRAAIATRLERRLRKICDPEAVDAEPARTKGRRLSSGVAVGYLESDQLCLHAATQARRGSMISPESNRAAASGARSKIEVVGLAKRYDGVDARRPAVLEVGSDRRWQRIGCVACRTQWIGKTTLLNIVARLLAPSAAGGARGWKGYLHWARRRQGGGVSAAGAVSPG